MAPTLSELPPWLVTGTAVALGLFFGSFLNVVIHRLPRGESLSHPGSRCPACSAPIRPWNNVPVLSWLLLRGRAACCGARISPRYPLIELAGGLLAWALLRTLVAALPSDTPWWRAAVVFALHLGIGLALIAAAFIDLEHMILPDEITLGGAAIGLLSVPLRGLELHDAAIGTAAGFGVIWLLFVVLYRKIRGVAGMGLGDAKLVMLAGAWFGWRGAAFTLLGGAVQGTLVTLVVLLVRGRIDEPEAVKKEREELHAALAKAEGEEKLELERVIAEDPVAAEPSGGLGLARVPFGPFLALAALEYLVLGKEVIESWLDFLVAG